jgi:hypothetical protein
LPIVPPEEGDEARRETPLRDRRQVAGEVARHPVDLEAGVVTAGGLGVLGLVLGHQVEDEAARRQGLGVVREVGPGEGVERPRADLVEVAAGRGLAEDRGLGASRARGLDRVVDVLELRVQRGRAREAPHQPELLVGGDVAGGPRAGG